MDPTKNTSFHARLLEAVGQAVIATDPLGKILYWNKAAQELYGWSAEQAMGRSIVEVTTSEEMGCDLVQGYHLAKALPSEEVELLLAERQVY